MSEKNRESEIKLSMPYKFNGVESDTLTMRRPKVKDQRLSGKVKGDTADQELALFGSLCGVAPADLDDLDIDDYVLVQGAYEAFL